MVQSALARLIFDAHVLRALAEAGRGEGGRGPDFEGLVGALGVPPAEARAGLDRLRAEGFLEGEGLRLTPSGLAFANDLCKRRLAPLRRALVPRQAAVAA